MAILTALLASGLAVSSAVAQQTPHQHGTATPTDATPSQGGMTAGGMMPPSEAMQANQQKMQEMRAMMLKAQATSDPAERQRLMVQHRQMMQAQMVSMMKGDNAAMIRACHEHMAMMHDMMAQMAAEQETMPAK